MSDTEIKEIIDRIKARRIELNLSYQDIANKTGISKSTIQRYETGYIKKVPINHIEIIAKALNINPGYLMGWEPSIFECSNKANNFTEHEEELIKKYRQLDADDKKEIDILLDTKYKKTIAKSKDTQNKVG